MLLIDCLRMGKSFEAREGWTCWIHLITILSAWLTFQVRPSIDARCFSPKFCIRLQVPEDIFNPRRVIQIFLLTAHATHRRRDSATEQKRARDRISKHPNHPACSLHTSRDHMLRWLLSTAIFCRYREYGPFHIRREAEGSLWHLIMLLSRSFHNVNHFQRGKFSQTQRLNSKTVEQLTQFFKHGHSKKTRDKYQLEGHTTLADVSHSPVDGYLYNSQSATYSDCIIIKFAYIIVESTWMQPGRGGGCAMSRSYSEEYLCMMMNPSCDYEPMQSKSVGLFAVMVRSLSLHLIKKYPPP